MDPSMRSRCCLSKSSGTRQRGAQKRATSRSANTHASVNAGNGVEGLLAAGDTSTTLPSSAVSTAVGGLYVADCSDVDALRASEELRYCFPLGGGGRSRRRHSSPQNGKACFELANGGVGARRSAASTPFHRSPPRRSRGGHGLCNGRVRRRLCELPRHGDSKLVQHLLHNRGLGSTRTRGRAHAEAVTGAGTRDA